MKKTILNALWAKIKSTFVEDNSDAILHGIDVGSGAVNISGGGINVKSGAVTLDNGGIKLGTGMTLRYSDGNVCLSNSKYLDVNYVMASSGISYFDRINVTGNMNIGSGGGTSINNGGISVSNGTGTGISITGGSIDIGTTHIKNTGSDFYSGTQINSSGISLLYGKSLDIGSGAVYITGGGIKTSGTISGKIIDISGSGYILGSGGLYINGSGIISGQNINISSGAVNISGGGITLGSGIGITGSGFYLNEYGFGTSGFYCSGAQANFSNEIMLYSGSINLQGSSGSINFGSSYLKIKGYTGTTGSGMTTMSNIVIDSSNKLEVPMIISLSYSQLVSLRSNSGLVKGRQYRITDYVTKTSQIDTQSANHAFDIIVTADDTNKLNENARAIRHSGNTYFANSKLEAWEIKYCLDNDTDRFAWADSTNGKGVIYYMKDEFGNECPYDFKNILYLKKIGFTAYGQYGSSYTTTYSRYESNDTTVSGTTYYGFRKIYYIPGPGSMPEYIWTTTTALTTSMLLYSVSGGNVTSVTGTVTKVDTEEFATYTFDKNDSDASISGNSLSVVENKIASYVNNNKQTLNSIYFRSTSSNLSVYGNSFNVNCYNMSFGYNCFNNTFGTCNYNNFFGNSFYNNSFGNDCYNNSFGSYCHHNFFGNECYSNSFGDNCQRNSFGNYFYSNTIGNSCVYNSFGNSFFSNYFGSACNYNSFGNNCNLNTFENNCTYNSFGNSCYGITFSKRHTYYVIVENGNRFITLTSTQTTSSTNSLKNITIAQGVNNTNTRKTISHNTVNDTFKTTYQPVNSQIISV